MAVPTNLTPTRITQLPEYAGSSTLGYLPYVLEGRTYKVQFANIAEAGGVPPSRTLTAGAGLIGGGDLSANRTFAISFSSSTPAPLGTASAGVADVASREDHVHPAVDLSDADQTQGALPLGRGGTGDALSPVAGAVAYSDADSLALTSAGTAGQVLTSNGAGTPYWSTITGTVTSVAASGGTTGLSFTGSPITGSGTLTLGGTLAVASGGTGATDAATARVNLGAAASGANSDITSLSGITGAISEADSVSFALVPAAVPTAVGSMFWDDADGIKTMNIVMADGVTQQVGEEQYFRVKATAAITNGQCVMFTGSVGASGGLTAAPSTGVTNGQYVMGVATQDIAHNGWGYITQFGLVRNINTSGSSVSETWADGDILYYNPAVTGGLTKTAPLAPDPKVVVAAVVYASASNGSLFVRVQAYPALQGLSDVYAPSPITNGQLLIGDGVQARWESATLTAGGNISITNSAGAITISATDQYVGTVTSVSGTGTVNGITLTGTVTSSGSLTLGGTLSGVSLTTQVTGTLPVGNGGTGATTLTGVVIGNGTSAFTTVAAPSGTIVGTSDTQTLTNKRVTARVNAQTTTASPWAWNSDSYDQQSFSALANALTINADAGTPTDGQKTILRFKDNGTTRTLTFTGGASNAFRDITGLLTVSGSNWTYATTANKTVYIGCVYNSADSRWDVVALTSEP